MVWLHLLIFQEKMVSPHPRKFLTRQWNLGLAHCNISTGFMLQILVGGGRISEGKISLGGLYLTLSPLPGVPTQLSTLTLMMQMSGDSLSSSFRVLCIVLLDLNLPLYHAAHSHNHNFPLTPCCQELQSMNSADCQEKRKKIM